jgi:subtilisin family serine protease
MLTLHYLKVVLMSLGTDYKDSSGSTKGYTREQAEAKQLGIDFGKTMNAIFRLGVPIVLASGNEGDNDRTSIDHIPQVLEKDEFPVINVGSATLDGKAASSSQGQGGTQLTIYAVGDKVDVHNQTDGQKTQDSGTSFAAAAVAGILAVHMNYQPWNKSKTGMDRVKEVKRWITTDESSFERTLNLNPPVNMVSKVILISVRPG